MQKCKQFCKQLNRNTLTNWRDKHVLLKCKETFPSHLKQNKRTVKRHSFFVFSHMLGTSNSGSNTVRSLNVSGQWSREFQPLCFPYLTCLIIRTERINNRGDGDLQSLWPASSENVLVNLLLLHCGHCLWDWTFPHGSRKQQTNVCAD